MTKIGWLLVCWGLLQVSCALAQAPPLKPTYWKQRLFFIPYQMNQQSKLLNPIAKVQLLTSRTGTNDWAPLQEAKPNVQGFSYHAPEDGEYWFALRHLDRQGQPWPSAAVQPQMRIIVDTAPPEIALSGSPNLRGEVVIRYEARDANLEPTSLVIEVRGAGGRWSPLEASSPDIAQPDRLVGRALWRLPTGVDSIEVRAAIADRAGQRGQAETKIAVLNKKYPVPSTPSPSTPSATGPNFPGLVKHPSLSPKRLPSQDWPTNNHLPQVATASESARRQAPPPRNPYAVGNQVQQKRTPARLVGEGVLGEGVTGDGRDSRRDSRRPTAPTGQMQSLRMTPLDTEEAPSLADSTSPAARNAKPMQDAWTPARPANDTAVRMVNSRTFDVEYDLESVGPWGVSKVELWGTDDNGRHWQSYGVDPDNRSPIRVTVPGAGTYGFRILVDGANSAGSPRPQAGDEPELTLLVDLQPPTAELTATELGQGNLSDHLLMRWTASDTNLEPRPIALFYSSYPNGPWSTIASGLENTGSYTWRMERHVPGRFYLRLEARDTAGNLTNFQTPSPISLSRPQPMGRLRSVRPVE